MTLTAIIGALMALMPSVKALDRMDKLDGLSDQIELDRLARELATQRELVEHWKDEAQRMATQLRVDREMYQRLLQRERDRHLADSETRSLHRQYALMQQAAQYQQGLNQQGLNQQAQNQLAQVGFQQALSPWPDFCNCVPGRHQVFEAERQRAISKGETP